MKPDDKKQLDDVSKKLDDFLDVYYRTHNIDKDLQDKPLYINDRIIFKDGTLNTEDGLVIGGSSSQLLGFYGATAVDQPATVNDPSGGVTVDSQSRVAIAEIIDRLQELGLIQ